MSLPTPLQMLQWSCTFGFSTFFLTLRVIWVQLDNIMLHGNWPYPTVKLCDFGYSKAYDLQSACKTTCGTPEYICPEVRLLLCETCDRHAP